MAENSENRENPNEEFLKEESGNPGDTGRKERIDERLLSKAQKEDERDEGRRNAFQALLIRHLPCIFRASLIIIGVIIVIRALHLVLPAYLCWMDESQLDFVDKVLAFIFGVVITKYFPKVFPEKSPLK